MAPRIDGVLETALYVDDLARARRFYVEMLNLAELVADSRMVALDAGRRTVLLLFRRGATLNTVEFPGGTIPRMTATARSTSRLPFHRPILLPGKPSLSIPA